MLRQSQAEPSVASARVATALAAAVRNAVSAWLSSTATGAPVEASNSRTMPAWLGRPLAPLPGAAEVRRHDTDDDEIELQARENAREVIVSLVGSLTEISRSSRGLREASRQVQADLEKIYMSLQSQDRLTQMLNAVTEDMARFSAWQQGEPDAAASSPALWLERMEGSYTMEELRSSHHNTVAVERSAAVEFF